MKNAELWKRILNQGILCDLGRSGVDQARSDSLNIALQNSIPNQIIKSPIVVDSTTGSLDGKIDWNLYKHLSFPFDKFWIEGVCDEMLWGSQVIVDELVFHAFCFTAPLVTGIPGLTCIARVQLNQQKSLVLTESGSPQITGETSLFAKDEFGNKLAERSLFTQIAFICDSLRMLGCKNVELAAHPIDRTHAKVTGPGEMICSKCGSSTFEKIADYRRELPPRVLTGRERAAEFIESLKDE